MTTALTGPAVVLEALARLAIARGVLMDDVAGEVYLDALEDVSPELVARACRDLAKLARGDYETALPSVGTIRERCQQITTSDAADAALARLLPAPKSEQDEPKYFCLDCRDEPSGWRPFHCQGVGETRQIGPGRDGRIPVRQCERVKPHNSHSYSERCPCFETNPEIQKHQRRIAEARQRREQKKSMR